MPAQIAVSILITDIGVSYFVAMYIAGAFDAYLLGALFPPDKASTDLGTQNINVKSSAEPHKICYGRCMTGGTVVFLDVLGRHYLTNSQQVIKEKHQGGKNLHMVLALAAHPIDAVEEIWLDENKVFELNNITGELVLVSDKYKGVIEAIAYNGDQSSGEAFITAQAQMHATASSTPDSVRAAYYAYAGVTNITGSQITIDPTKVWSGYTPAAYSYVTGGKDDRVETSGTFDGTYTFIKHGWGGSGVPDTGPLWDSTHNLTNTAYIYFKFTHNPDVYKGLPTPRIVFRGKKVYDPRQTDRTVAALTDRDTWTTQVAYVPNDLVSNPVTPSVRYICEKAHTAFDTITGGLTFEEAFDNDFVIEHYWKRFHVLDDPSTWEWSDNWALCLRDYLTSGSYYSVLDNVSYTKPVTLYGLGIKSTEINDENIIDAANVADEQVYYDVASLPIVFTEYDAVRKFRTIEVTGDVSDLYVKYECVELTVGGVGKVTTGSKVPLDVSKPVVIDSFSHNISLDYIHILSSYYDSGRNRTVIIVRYTNTGTPTAIRLSARRFSINGIVNTSNSPINVLENMLACAAGKLPYTGGKFLVVPGVYAVPTVTIDESILAGPVEVAGSLGSSDLINKVIGTFKNPAAYWEETDFADQTSATYVTEDGGYELVKTVRYNFLSSNFDCQRISRIALQRSREGVSAVLVCNLRALNLSVGEFINVSIDRLGWVNKVFSINSWSYQNNTVTIAIREENPVAYVWDSPDLTPIPQSPDTTFKVLPGLEAVTGLTMTSGTNELLRLADGSIVPRVHIQWTNPANQDANIKFELLIYRTLVDDTTEEYLIFIENDDTEEYWLNNIIEGDVIDVTLGVRYSDPNILNPINPVQTTLLSHTVVGKTEPPADVSGFIDLIQENLLVLSWDVNTDIDFSHYEIRKGNAWSDNDVVDTTTSTSYIISGIVSGNTNYFIKAIDTSDNESVSAAVTTATINSPGAPALLDYTLQLDNIALNWGVASAGTFPVAYYELRYGTNPTFASNTLITQINSTSYTVSDLYLGTRTFRVVAVDIYGTTSPQTTKNIIINFPSTPIVSSSSLNADRVEFTWSVVVDPLTQFQIESFEISGGDSASGQGDNTDATGITLIDAAATFLSTASVGDLVLNVTDGSSGRIASVDSGIQLTLEQPGLSGGSDNGWAGADSYIVSKFILASGTNGFSRRVDWTTAAEPSRIFRVRAVDHGGNKGYVGSIDVAITVPNGVSIVQKVIDNNVLLTWTEPTIHDLPIDYYEIRKGNTYASSEIIGTISGLFAVVFETIAGDYTYWITAVDSAANFGDNSSILASVSQPPDYQLLSNAINDFVTIDVNFLSHTITNGAINAQGDLLLPVDDTETWTQHFTTPEPDWATPQAQIDAGFPIYVQPTPASGSYVTVYDIGTIVSNLSITSDVTSEIVAGDPVTTTRIETAEFNTVPTGTVTTADATGITLTDSTKDFSTLTSAGSLVTNITDGSTAVIQTVGTDTVTLAGTGLTGGTDNQWDISDSYTIDNWIDRGSSIASSLKVFVPTFRYVRLSFEVASSAADTDIWKATSNNIRIDVKEQTESGSGSVTATGGTAVTLIKDWIDINSITVTAKGNSTTKLWTLYDFLDDPNPTTFDVYIFNEAGVEQSTGDFSWVVRGY